MNWTRVWAIARWEYFQKVRSKAFIILLILTPILITAFGVLPTLLAGAGPESTQAVGVVDRTGEIYQDLRAHIESTMKLPDGQPVYLLASYLLPGGNVDSAIAAADRHALEGVTEGTLVIDDSAGTRRVIYRSPNPNDIKLLSQFERGINQVALRRRLREAGIDSAMYSRLQVNIDIDAVKVNEPGVSESSDFLTSFFTAYAGSFLLMIVVLTTGQSLVRSLVEEKSNRIMELLVGSSRPYELMWGKLLGLGGLGITQLLSWLLLGLGAVTFVALPAGFASSLEGIYDVIPLMLVYLLLGYIFYAAIFIAVGSLVTTEQEAQVMTSYLVMLLVMPTAFAVVVIQDPDASYVRILSYIPLFTPQLMTIRTVTKMPALWEIAATLVVMAAATVGVVWAAGKVFRTAILLYGKRPSMREIVRWMRAE